MCKLELTDVVSANGLGKDIWTLPLENVENVLFVSDHTHTRLVTMKNND